jgi:hypothetical protein
LFLLLLRTYCFCLKKETAIYKPRSGDARYLIPPSNKSISNTSRKWLNHR